MEDMTRPCDRVKNVGVESQPISLVPLPIPAMSHCNHVVKRSHLLPLLQAVLLIHLITSQSLLIIPQRPHASLILPEDSEHSQSTVGMPGRLIVLQR